MRWGHPPMPVSHDLPYFPRLTASQPLTDAIIHSKGVKQYWLQGTGRTGRTHAPGEKEPPNRSW